MFMSRTGRPAVLQSAVLGVVQLVVLLSMAGVGAGSVAAGAVPAAAADAVAVRAVPVRAVSVKAVQMQVVMVTAVFVLPVPAPASVLTPFRAPASRYGRGHRGVDLAVAAGGQVRAAGAGLVTHAGPVAGRGTVTVQHPDGLLTTYEPVTATVRTGQLVGRGQPIGAVETGHASCAPASCLHWGARLPDGSYLDPMGLINGLEVRLLPWDQARG